MNINKKLIRGSLILLITFNLFNLLNFFFQFAMARLLNPAEYGILAALFAIIYIASIFSESIQTIIAKITAQHSDNGEVKNIFKRVFRKSVKFSLAIFIFYLFVAIPLSFLLKIKYVLLAFPGLIIFFSFLLPIPRGILQGKKMFKKLGFNLITESTIKLFFGIFMVLLASFISPNLKIYAAILSVFLGSFFAFFLSLSKIKEIFVSNEKEVKLGKLYDYSAPIFILTISIIAFYSVDVLVAKIFFSEEVAGFYALAALVAKALFWGTQPISKAMFPLSSEEKKKSSSSKIFRNSLFILLAILLFFLVIIYFFPDFIIRIISGRYIKDSSSILFYVSLSMAFLSISNLILLHKVSKKTNSQKFYILIIPICTEILLLSLFSKSLILFSKALCLSAIIFLLFSILLFRKNEVSNNNSRAQ